jgi:F-type H+/Na+-transporting ATPase subunit beta
MAQGNGMGRVVQVIGPVVDVEFDSDAIPEIYNALEIKVPARRGRQDIRVVAEVQQHIGRSQVRAVAMSSTDGLQRGMPARNTGAAITVPVGAPALGRILNVLGEPVDEAGDIPTDAGCAGRSTAMRRSSRSSSRRPRSSRPASRSSTSSRRT